MSDSGISINPDQQSGNDSLPGGKQPFMALVKVVKSRYERIQYPPEKGFTDKIGITWTYETTKGNLISKSWSTGLVWDGPSAGVSPDGKRLVPKTPDCKGYKANTDALYFVRKVLESGFPAAQLTDDISVFEGKTFYIKDSKNPNFTNSGVKVYPETYHPEGWDAALATQAANRAAKEIAKLGTFGNAAQGGVDGNKFSNTATLTSAQSVPSVVLTPDFMAQASTALFDMIMASGGTLARNDIPTSLKSVGDKYSWDVDTRRKMTMSLWDIPTLTTIVAQNPSLSITPAGVVTLNA